MPLERDLYTNILMRSGKDHNSLFVPTGALAGDPEVIQISPDINMITRSSKAGMFTNMSMLKTRVTKQANDFAESKCKIAVPISERVDRPAVGGFPSYEYQFRVNDPGSPDSKSTALKSSPYKITVPRNDFSGGVTVRHETNEKPDLYSELIKLNDGMNLY